MSRLSWGEMLQFPSFQEEGVPGGSWGGSSHLSPAQPPWSEDHTDVSFPIVLCGHCRQTQSAMSLLACEGTFPLGFAR